MKDLIVSTAHDTLTPREILRYVQDDKVGGAMRSISIIVAIGSIEAVGSVGLCRGGLWAL